MGKDKIFFVYLKAFILAMFVLSSLLFVQVKEVKAAGPTMPYSFFLEHPYSITGVRANGMAVDLDDSGWLFMNEFRADVNIYQNLFGIYAKFPFAGVTDFGPNDEDDYDFGNIGLGGKVAILNTDSAVLTGGFELITPTTSGDLGADAALAYFLEFPYFLEDAWTFKPYAVFGYSRGIFGFQANLSGDIITNADDFEGDDTEFILEYGATASVTPNLPLPFSTSFLLELFMASSTSFDNNITGAYLTPGVRFGGQILSLGAGVQIPFGSDEITDFANVGFLLDLVIRFGS